MMHLVNMGLAERPDGAHDLARLASVALADADDHEVVKDALGGEVDVHDFRDGEAHEREENALDGLTHPGVLHGRLADDGGGVDGVFAVSDGGEVEDGVDVGHGVEAGVVAEGAFAAEFADVDVAFEDVLGVGGDLQVDGFALDEFDRGLAEETGDEELFDFGRCGDDGGEGHGGVGTDGDGDIHAGAADFVEGDGRQAFSGGCRGGAAAGHRHEIDAVGVGEGGGAHAGRGGVRRRFSGAASACRWCARVDLHAVHAGVALAGFRVFGHDERQRNVAAAIAGPGF